MFVIYCAVIKYFQKHVFWRKSDIQRRKKNENAFEDEDAFHNIIVEILQGYLILQHIKMEKIVCYSSDNNNHLDCGFYVIASQIRDF